ncbi:uncharacterized protein LOC115736040 isoform X2 [Rhodamnia argentea]|uniref:Uncharacterized protein LOC115736040 isoform X2 n=1 Tax=Rhodamnia argentea TaxID=178133 RepID=A0ABM3HBD8_9MYRT|nr:uncharacterized protein LOC115736040 isoform X2 [Rhodamnia argentea]
MAITQTSSIFTKVAAHPLPGINGRKLGAVSAKKGDLTDPSSKTRQQPGFALRVSNPILARAAIAVFGLGFIDAGGDWSRIGAISKEGEDLLRIAAFLVVPLCIFAIFSTSKDSES